MNAYTGTTTTPCVSGGHNSETYWVGGSKTLPITRENSIQAWRPNAFHSVSIITKNCTEGLPYEKKLSSNESKSKINLTSWIACIRSYTENNGMETIFRIYDPYLKTGVYLLDEWDAAKDGKVSKWVQTLTTTGVRYVQVNCLPIFNFD